MYKILLIDDEGIAIRSLKHLITDRFGDTCDIHSLQSASQVVDNFQRFLPDIVLINVNMTGVHGIYTIRKLHAIHKDCLYIVLSHSKKTHYQKEGVFMNIVDYLKKPLHKEELMASLEAALARVDQERDLRLRQKQNKEKLQTVVPIIESGFITEILFHDEKERDLKSYRDLLNIPVNYGWVMTLDFCESMIDGHMVNPVGATIRLQQQITLFRTILKAFFPSCVIGPVLANRIVVFLPCLHPSMTAEEQEFRHDRAEHMMKQLRKKLNLYFSLGIGDVQSIEEIHNSKLY